VGEVEVPTADTGSYSSKQSEAVGTNGISIAWLTSLLTDPLTLAGIALYGISTLVWLVALKMEEISRLSSPLPPEYSCLPRKLTQQPEKNRD